MQFTRSAMWHLGYMTLCHIYSDFLDPAVAQVHHLLPAVNSDPLAAKAFGDGKGCTRSAHWVQHDAPGWAEALDEVLDQLLRERGFVFVGKLTSNPATADIAVNYVTWISKGGRVVP